MKTVICEKKSQAEDIARVIGADQKRYGYFEGNGYYVVWLHGHILTMVPVDDPGWDITKLPFIPQRFEMIPIAEKTSTPGKKDVFSDEGNKKLLKTIHWLVSKSDGVVIATDAGREGEQIARETLNYVNCNLPSERLWISALDDDTIRDGFEHLYPSSEFDNLFIAAQMRTVADWLIGINATRALTLVCRRNHEAQGSRYLSLGRVQTVVLKMVCERYLEYKNFKSQSYWVIRGKSVVDGKEVRWISTEKYLVKYEGEKAKDSILNARYLTVKKVETKRVQDEAPLLHNIDSLQKIANSRYGYTLQDTLAAIQSLYDKKYCTYPRTDSRYISENVFKGVPELFAVLSKEREFGQIAKLLCDNADKLSRRCVNDTKLTDHHAIMVTKKLIANDSNLSEVEMNVYRLILMRCLESFLPDSVADVTTVTFLGGDDVELIARGRKIVRTGWKLVNRDTESGNVELEDADKQELDMGELPPMTEGMSIPIGTIELKEDQTKPRPLLTMGTLLTCMETAGSRTDNKQLAKALSRVGIGTPATRTQIVTNLITRDYIRIQNKRSLVPTEIGLKVCESVKDMAISDVCLTANWEIQLEDVSDGKLAAKVYYASVRDYAKQITNEIIENPHNFKELSECFEEMIPKCPKCGKEIGIYKDAAHCRGCGLYISRNICKKHISEDTLRVLLKKGKTGIIKGWMGKNGKPFDAALELDKEKGNITFVFDR